MEIGSMVDAKFIVSSTDRSYKVQRFPFLKL